MGIMKALIFRVALHERVRRSVTYPVAFAMSGVNHLAVYIGQAALDAVVVVGQPLVVQAEQVQHGGVEIVDGADVLLRLCSRTRRSRRS